MIVNTLENSLRNYAFLCLFFTMLFYWIKGSFFYTAETSKIETIFLVSCNILLVSILFIRWIDSNHFPLSNLYESLIFLSWSLITFLLVLQLKTKDLFLGILLTPIILLINTFATFSLPVEMQKANPLVPALQSNWLMMHVTVMMLSYAALICGSLLSLTFLIIKYFLKKNIKTAEWSQAIIENSIESTAISTFSQSIKVKTFKPSNYASKKVLSNNSTLNITTIFNKNIWNNKNDIEQIKSQEKNIIEKLDNLSYRIIGIGFPLLTIGILSGAIWANETWGSYWSWDPKETWALITWIIYSIYLHSRIIKGWKGEKPALIATLGFITVWICYLGVNIFGKGLHSYGWFNF